MVKKTSNTKLSPKGMDEHKTKKKEIISVNDRNISMPALVKEPQVLRSPISKNRVSYINCDVARPIGCGCLICILSAKKFPENNFQIFHH